MLKRRYLQNAIEKTKPDMKLIDVVPFVHEVLLFLLEKLGHVVDQRIDETNHEDEVDDVTLGVRGIELLLVFQGK
jgi:hypothetical protein